MIPNICIPATNFPVHPTISLYPEHWPIYHVCLQVTNFHTPNQRPAITTDGPCLNVVISLTRANRQTSFMDTMIWGVGKVYAFTAALALITSGTEEWALRDISVYPNPAGDVLTIDAEGIESVQLTNTIGQVCLNSDTAEKTISLTGLKSGIYFLSVYGVNNKLIAQQKIIAF